MNKPVKYQSQLRYYKNQLIIDYASSQFKIIYFSMIALILFGFIMFAVGMLANGGFFYFLSVLVAAILLRFLPTYPQITIDNEAIISKKQKITLPLKDLDKLDIQVRILENRTEILLENISFELENPSDVVLLTDEIEEYAKLKYFKSEPVDNQTEILMFKAKKSVSLNSKSYIKLNDNLHSIYIYDALNHDNWFEISKPLFDGGIIKSSFLGKKNIPLQDVHKLNIEIDKQAGILKNKHQIKIVIVTNAAQQTVFKSFYRLPNNEISTFRDSEEIYKLLKKSSFFANIKIEKVIITS